MFKRIVLYGLFILAWLGYMATDVHCADKHITNAGAGTGDGSSYANAYSNSDWQTALDSLGCGDTLYIHGAQTYTKSVNTSSNTGQFGNFQTISCADGNERTLLGVVEGTTTPAAYDDMPILDGNYNYLSPASDASFAAFSASADINGIKISNLRVQQVRHFFRNTTTGRNDVLRFENLYIDDTQETFYIYGNGNCTAGPAGGSSCNSSAVAAASSDIDFNNVYISGVVKNGIRFQRGAQNIYANNVHVNCGGYEYNRWNGNPPSGWNFGPAEDTPEHDIAIYNSSAIACNGARYPSSSGTYTQGDGFAFERYVYNVYMENVVASDNTDGGFDTKAPIYVKDGLFIRNKRNVRFTGSTLGRATCENCFIAWALKPANMTTGEGWANVHAFSNGLIINSTIYNLGGATSGGLQNFIEKSGGSVCSPAITVEVKDSIYVIDSASVASGDDATNNNTETDCNLDIDTNVTVYDNKGSVTSGSDPGLGSVPEATTALSSSMNNSSFGSARGFYYAGSFLAPPAPVGLSCSAVSDSQIDCSWSEPPLTADHPFITGYLVDRESPAGNGFSTITTVTGEDLTNGTFEGSFTSGLGSSWQEMNEAGSDITPTQETTIKYAGSNSQKVVASNFDDGVMQLITVANGTSCTSSVQVYVPTGTDSARIRCKTQEEGDDYTVYGSAAVPASTNDQWQLLSWSWTKGSDGNQARNACYVSSGASGTFTWYMDNFSTVCGGVNTAYSHTGLSASTQYNTRVSSINSVGTGDSSTSAATTTAAPGGTSETASSKVIGGAKVVGGCTFKR